MSVRHSPTHKMFDSEGDWLGDDLDDGDGAASVPGGGGGGGGFATLTASASRVSLPAGPPLTAARKRDWERAMAQANTQRALRRRADAILGRLDSLTTTKL